MTSAVRRDDSTQAATVFLWIRIATTYLSIPLLLFVCAWDLLWWQAWIFSVLIVAAGIGGRFWAERRHPGLLAEREQAKSNASGNVKRWDRILAPLMGIALSFPLTIVAGLDRRYRWSRGLPEWLSIPGTVMILLGYSFAVWALAENRFFSSLVRIQKDRGHVVCDSGPYRIVRHPGYAGNALALPGIALALGSLWTLIPAAVALLLVVVRTFLEDRTLIDELAGYRGYAQRVRYRLIPGVF